MPLVALCWGWAPLVAQPQPPPTATQGGAPTFTPGAPGSAPVLLVVETETRGVDPVIGRLLNGRIAARAHELGYRVSTPTATRARMVEAGLSYPPSMTGLWTLMHRSNAQRAVYASVWAAASRYAFVVWIASADGTGPQYLEGRGDETQLLARFDALLASALPVPGAPLVVEDPVTQRREQAKRGAKYYDTAGPRPPPEPRHRPLRLVLQGSTAFGLDDSGFRNHTLGARFDYRLDRDSALGFAVAYANLKGRQERSNSLLFALQFEDRVPLSRGSSFHIPLRAALGYLVNNGPLLRFAAGLAVDVGERTDIVVELLAPTFWVAPERLLFSLDLGAEVGYRF